MRTGYKLQHQTKQLLDLRVSSALLRKGEKLTFDQANAAIKKFAGANNKPGHGKGTPKMGAPAAARQRAGPPPSRAQRQAARPRADAAVRPRLPRPPLALASA